MNVCKCEVYLNVKLTLVRKSFWEGEGRTPGKCNNLISPGNYRDTGITNNEEYGTILFFNYITVEDEAED